MLIATPCVKASVVLYNCAAGSPASADRVSWRPHPTFSCNHFSRTFKESRTKEPSDWILAESFVHDDRRLMRAAEGLGDSRNSDPSSISEEEARRI